MPMPRKCIATEYYYCCIIRNICIIYIHSHSECNNNLSQQQINNTPTLMHEAAFKILHRNSIRLNHVDCNEMLSYLSTPLAWMCRCIATNRMGMHFGKRARNLAYKIQLN